MINAQALLEKRAGLIAQARGIYDKAEEEGRDATAEEREQFDTLMNDSDATKVESDRLHRLATAEEGLPAPEGAGGGGVDDPDARTEPTIVELRTNVCGETRSVVVPAEEIKVLKAFRSYLQNGNKTELRDLQKDVDSKGGYLSAPIQFMAELIKGIDNLTFMRQISRVLPPIGTAESLGAPQIDSDISDAEWTTELGTDGEDSDLTFARRELKPIPLAKKIKISKTLVRRSEMDAVAIVRDRMAYKFAVPMENGYMNGNGTTQPLGVFTADAAGIDTDRDVAEDNTATAFTMDGLINAQMHVKAQYRNMAVWVMHRDAIKLARKLKDNDEQYLWQPSTQLGIPDRLLNNAVWESEYAPNTFTTGKYVGIFGNFEFYWIIDALTLTIQVLEELYAETNQNGYIGRAESDGAPVTSEAFSRVTLA